MTPELLRRRPDSGFGNVRSSPSDPSRNIDWVLLGVQAVLTVGGLFVIYSASRFQVPDDPYVFVNRQVVFAIAACVVMAAVMAIDHDWFEERAAFLYGVTMVLLCLLLLVGFAGGANRITFNLGAINLQPAEIAKFTVLLALAAYLAAERTEGVSYPRFLGGLILVGAPTALIVAQPDLGGGLMLIALVMGVMLVAGAKPRYIAVITFLSLATIAVALVTGLVNDYQKDRLRVFLDPNTTDPAMRDAGYQVRNAIRAVGTGGVRGKGWLQGDMTNSRHVPVMWADFPFAAIGEQFGLVGSATVLGLMALVLVRVWRIASLSRDLLGTYICAGVFTMLLWQTFQNVGMTLQIMPVTGLPLPFISYGGSGLIVYFAMLGLVQSVHMRRMR